MLSSVNQRLLVGGLWEEVGGSGDGVVRVRLLADLDLATVALARKRLSQLCRDEAVRCLLLRLGPDRFVDVRGLDVLVGASARMRDGGRSLIVAEPPSSLLLMIDALRMSGRLRVTATVRQAMALVAAS